MKNETIRDFLLRGEKEDNFVIKDISTHGCGGGVISELIYFLAWSKLRSGFT